MDRMPIDRMTSADRLTRRLDDTRGRPAIARLRDLVDAGLDVLPQPGGGRTFVRWQALAAVARSDLSLVKLYEGHTDALAIRAELGAGGPVDGATWAVWAAESRQDRVLIEGNVDGRVRLRGRKRWCSGADGVDRALMTAWHADGSGPQLVDVAMRQPGVRVDAADWRAVGMRDSAGVDVLLDGVEARLVGRVGDYLSRPGFWHGGAGVAACWYGGALRLAQPLRERVTADPTPLGLAALGRADTGLAEGAAMLAMAAGRIDARPSDDAQRIALQTRRAIETVATRVLDLAGRVLGATPYCRDAEWAQAAADLPVFLRQSHADRDDVAIGEQVLKARGTWTL